MPFGGDHDKQRWARSLLLQQAHSQLPLHGATWGWLDFALTAGAEFPRTAGKISFATAERLADTCASRRLCEASGSVPFFSVPHAYHELLMAIDAVRV